ncbi:M23 family metallopeptidase [Nocardia sp. NBC_00508]|uniref:M23 family metallopeptidase n=1 Tax=Nocardia sp. NBC_00508 TaxID=2975992 RepID=UPI002E80109E|nr:M23 family metallopeptidase [Nocardia sp. NBC_00508]WUD69122.1 M23 family metallopeptidase [Nocardia sp. NBC_00508]
MTSGEAAQLADDEGAVESGPAENEPGAHGPPTSTADQKQHDIAGQAARILTDLARYAPGGPTGTPASGTRTQAVSSPGTPAAPNGVQSPPPTGTVAPASHGAVPPPPGGVVSPPQGTPAPSGTPAPAEAPPPPGIDPETIASLAPMAMMALPMLASALSGLAGGGSGAPSGGSVPTAAEPGAAALSPEAQQALKALKTLAAMYGTDGTASGTNSLGSGTGGIGGSGAGATAIKARALFQKNAARAFNTLDNELARYISRLSGSNKTDRKAVIRLVRDVNVQLAELGPAAYTKEGQRKAHQILTEALRKAQAIVRGGQANATETAAMVNRLTAQYLNALAGKRTQLAGALPGSGRPRSPLDPGRYRISSHFGPRGGKHHGGLDMAAPAGTPIYAATGGTVVKAGNYGGGFGYQVRIRSADGTETIYAHQTPGSIRVRAGDRIPAGTMIGAVGSTGNSTGPHLHYEVRRNGQPVEPIAYLASQGVRV